MTVPELKSRKEIATWITAELQKVKTCEECTVNSVMPLRQPDRDGCNWSDSIVVRAGPEADYEPHLRRIVQEARRRFNVAQ